MPKPKSVDGPRSRAALQVAPDACDIAGNWSWDAASGCIRTDAFVAFLFNVDPDEAELGLPVSAYAAGIYPPDRTRVLSEFRERSWGDGLAVIEHRVCSADGVQRWVLSRGRFTYDHLGRPLTGHGIIVDITDLQVREAAADIEPDADGPRETPLEHAAAAMITTFRAIDQLNDPELKAQAEALLFAIGQRLAAQQAKDQRTRLN